MGEKPTFSSRRDILMAIFYQGLSGLEVNKPTKYSKGAEKFGFHPRNVIARSPRRAENIVRSSRQDETAG